MTQRANDRKNGSTLGGGEKTTSEGEDKNTIEGEKINALSIEKKRFINCPIRDFLQGRPAIPHEKRAGQAEAEKRKQI